MVIDALKNLVNLKQHEDENLVDYTRRFKSARDVHLSQWGSRMLITKLAMEDPNWNDSDVFNAQAQHR